MAVGLKERFRRAVTHAATDCAFARLRELEDSVNDGMSPRVQRVTVVRPLQLEAPTIEADYTVKDVEHGSRT